MSGYFPQAERPPRRGILKPAARFPRCRRYRRLPHAGFQNSAPKVEATARWVIDQATCLSTVYRVLGLGELRIQIRAGRPHRVGGRTFMY